MFDTSSAVYYGAPHKSNKGQDMQIILRPIEMYAVVIFFVSAICHLTCSGAEQRNALQNTHLPHAK